MTHSIIGKERQNEHEGKKANALPSRVLIPAVQNSKGDPPFREAASITTRQPEGRLTAQHQADPRDEHSASKAIDISARNHQGLTRNVREKDLENEQHKQNGRNPQPARLDSFGHCLRITKPLQHASQWLAELPYSQKCNYEKATPKKFLLVHVDLLWLTHYLIFKLPKPEKKLSKDANLISKSGLRSSLKPDSKYIFDEYG
jgi:hypothetical protein